MTRQGDYGIKGYNPTKPMKTRVPISCPDCWFVGYSKSVMTKHKQSEH